MATTEFLPGNALRLLNSGAEYFPALLEEIARARQEIFLESYIYADDAIGRAISEALCAAARRGVQVRLTVDGFGARNFRHDFLDSLTAAGVQAMIYRPERELFRLRRHRLRRLHRKLVVIDARIAFVGGINIVDDNNAPPALRPRYDYAVRIEGPILDPIHRAARRVWEIVAWASFKRRFRLPVFAHPYCPLAGQQTAAFLVRDNIRHRHDILNAYLDAIQSARHEILIANAYFLPGVRFARALYQAIRRGVRVRIILQGTTDHPLLRYATQTLYQAALSQGIRIFEYEKSFMHAKVAVIDGEWATVGSSNIDPFSLLLAKEANLFVRDPSFAQQLQASLEQALAAGGREILAAEFKQQTWLGRILRTCSYALIRLLIGLSGYGQTHWQAEEDKTADG